MPLVFKLFSEEQEDRYVLVSDAQTSLPIPELRRKLAALLRQAQSERLEKPGKFAFDWERDFLLLLERNGFPTIPLSLIHGSRLEEGPVWDAGLWDPPAYE